MSDRFRELLKKIASGTHTSKDLTRAEAAEATTMMLEQTATPAQIGAFMISHRIKRPTPEELAGMLDAYNSLGQKLSTKDLAFAYTPVVFGAPYDGRSRTVPVNPITTLILAAAGVPVVLHGGDCMPTKYGLPLITIWQELGVDFRGFSLSQAQHFLAQTGVGFVYQQKHFPQAYQLVPYREQIGKRPTISTLELIWSPVAGAVNLISGFVHPPTEERFFKTLKLVGIDNFVTIKGLEGSCDLSCNRTAIAGRVKSGQDFERILIHPEDYQLNGSDLALESNSVAVQSIQDFMKGKHNALTAAAVLNGGFYLWLNNICPTMETGLDMAQEMLNQGTIRDKLSQLQQAASNLCS